jgi:hypothetical protein
MSEHHFTLILTGPVDQHADELYDAGCDDALLGAIDGVPYADFDRQADTLAQAITAAIAQLQSVPVLRVVRVEPDDLVTAAEIAQRLGRTRESVRLLAAGQRGAGDFPPPISHTRQRNRLWRWADVLAWTGQADPDELAAAQFIAALNAALELRARTPTLPEPERRALAIVGD